MAYKTLCKVSWLWQTNNFELMKKRNCKKIVEGYFNRYGDKKPGEKIYATPKEIKAYEGLRKYKPNCWLLYIVHENLNCNDLCVWIGG